MAVQDRAESTRQIVLEAAAEVFAEVGYGSATMAHIVERAGVSRGACNHHFPTKESLAVALRDAADATMVDKRTETHTESSSALENMIRSSFAVQAVTQKDIATKVGTLLTDVVDYLGNPQEQPWQGWLTFIKAEIEDAIAQGDVKGDVDADKIGFMFFCGSFGNNRLAPTLGRNPFEGLATLWRVILGEIATPHSAPYFEQVVQRVTAHYSGDLLADDST